IAGVLAQSPFRNGAEAIQQFRPGDARVKLASMVLVHGGLKRMLAQVDIPTAVAKRDDLRIWLTTGERDYFDSGEQRAILAASRSPASMKQFTMIPGGSHGGQWKWKGNDELIRAFLAASAGTRVEPVFIVMTIAAAGCVAFVVIIYIRGGNPFRRRTSPASSCESPAA